VLQALRQFHDEHYSSNIMSLVVRSNSPAAELRRWIEEESHFSRIPNKDLKFEDFSEYGITRGQFVMGVGLPIEEDSINTLIKYKVLGNNKKATFAFQLKGILHNY
jgi:secreted Zn-dependent insulinase-like peptidase